MANTVSFNENYPDISRSDALYQRALQLMHPVTQTLAKGPTQFVNGVAPKYLKRGKGSHVWDVDGNEYIDYNMGVGPVSLGYAYPAVDEAIRKQLEDGISFSLMHELEVEATEVISRVIPNAESVRISKTGADVTSAAIRVSRAYTGREKVLCCGYHGWHDWYISVLPRDAGVPQVVKDLINTFEYNNLDSMREALDENTACVILEPFVFEKPRDGFLAELIEICHANGTLVIFDEMWTGFRVAIGGAQEYFNVTPDLATYSKAVANGMPVSFLTGRDEVMKLFEEDIFFFTTFGGEALSLAATIATVNEMIEHNVPAYLAEKGLEIQDGYNEIAKELEIDSYTACKGYPCRSLVTFDASAGDPLVLKSFVQQELIKRGILWSGFHNMCYSHSGPDIAHTLAAYRDVLGLLKEAVAAGDVEGRVRGQVLQPVFRKTGNFNTRPKEKETAE